MYAMIILMVLFLVGCQASGESDSTDSDSYQSPATQATETSGMQDLNVSENFGFHMQKQVDVEFTVAADSTTSVVELYGRSIQPEHQLAKVTVSQGRFVITAFVPASTKTLSLLQFDRSGNEIGLTEIELDKPNQELFFN